MSRPIIFTEKMKQQARKDFNAMLNDIKVTDGEINYRKSYGYKDCGAVVWLTAEAYRKILALVTGFSDEVGWHGTVSRESDSEFIIEDIFVYPQEVTGSTVNTDQTEYTKWLYELDDETFNKVRMQGHSHVHMGVSPSGTDVKHRQQILDQLEDDMYYIFMVWNKSLSVHTLVYDMSRNILYEDGDVDVRLIGGDGMDGFLTDAREKVRKKTYNKPKKREPEEQFEIEDFEEYGDFPYSLCGGRNYYDWGGQKWKV